MILPSVEMIHGGYLTSCMTHGVYTRVVHGSDGPAGRVESDRVLRTDLIGGTVRPASHRGPCLFCVDVDMYRPSSGIRRGVTPE